MPSSRDVRAVASGAYDVPLGDLLVRAASRIAAGSAPGVSGPDRDLIAGAVARELARFDAGAATWMDCTGASTGPADHGCAAAAIRRDAACTAALGADVRTALRRVARTTQPRHPVACSVVEAQLLIYHALSDPLAARSRPGLPHGGLPARDPGAPDDASAPGGVPNGAPGIVFWVCGLSGAGKTTFARRLVPALRAYGRRPVLLDGDALRVMLTGTAGYDVAARRWMGRCYAVLARLIAARGTDVVCAAISPFADLRRQQRSDIPRYCEIWVDAPLAVARARHPKRLYDAGHVARSQPVVGLDIPFEPPTAPDHVVVNVGARRALSVAARAIAASHPDVLAFAPPRRSTSAHARDRARGTSARAGRQGGA